VPCSRHCTRTTRRALHVLVMWSLCARHLHLTRAIIACIHQLHRHRRRRYISSFYTLNRVPCPSTCALWPPLRENHMMSTPGAHHMVLMHALSPSCTHHRCLLPPAAPSSPPAPVPLNTRDTQNEHLGCSFCVSRACAVSVGPPARDAQNGRPTRSFCASRARTNITIPYTRKNYIQEK
jgi:hypothetical protein